jgi:DNA invertase Pin-like site-specific DNA recombinase/transposase
MPVHIGKKQLPKSALDTGWHDLDPGLTSDGRDEIARLGGPRSRLAVTGKSAKESRTTKHRRRLRSSSALDDTQFLEDDPDEMDDDLDDEQPEHSRAGGVPAWARGGSTGEAEFDEIDRLTMRSNPVLVEPKESKKKKSKRIAIYARFSTSRQKQRSIVHQVKVCVAYYVTLGGKKHVLFADKGRTGKNMDRDGIQLLIAAVQAGEIDIIVFYSFDRISRELFGALDFFKILDDHGVELHSARSERRYTKEDAAREAMEAENDLKLRVERTMDGLDELVALGGLPWGSNFGLEPTSRRGFPKQHPVHSLTVKRIILDIVKMPAEDLAQILTEEGVNENPSGGTFWNASTVIFIARNVIYTGRIRYRRRLIKKNGLVFDSVSRKFRRPKIKYTVKDNDEYRWVKGYNEAYRIVTDAQFTAAANAIKSRTTNNGTLRGPGKEIAEPVFGSPVCDCRVIGPDQRFYLARTNDGHCAHRYICSLQGRNKSCRWKTGRSLPADIVETAIWEAVVPHIAKRMNNFGEAFKRNVGVVALQQDAKRAMFDADIAELRKDQTALLRSSIRVTFDEETVQSEADLIGGKLHAKRLARAAVPTISPEEIDFDGKRAVIEDGFELIRRRLPFVPADDDETALIEALQRAVLKIELGRIGRAQGRIGLQITVHWARLFLTDEQLEAVSYSPELIESEFILPFQWSGRNTGSLDYMAELAAGGLHALTEKQWTLVADRLPDLTQTDHNGVRPTETRTILNCILFLLRTEMPISAIPPFFGAQTLVYNAINRFISAGGLETFVAVFGEHDPAVIDGLDWDRLSNRRRAIDYSRVARVAIKPVETAARYAEEGRFALTDTQWNAISHVFDPRVEQPTGRDARPIGARLAMEGILVKLATHCAWGKMPIRLGGKALLGVATMIAYHGAWDAAFRILARDFPDLVKDLDTKTMDSMPRSQVLRRRELGRSDEPSMEAEASL